MPSSNARPMAPVSMPQPECASEIVHVLICLIDAAGGYVGCVPAHPSNATVEV